jgi:hypothetical protein
MWHIYCHAIQAPIYLIRQLWRTQLYQHPQEKKEIDVMDTRGSYSNPYGTGSTSPSDGADSSSYGSEAARVDTFGSSGSYGDQSQGGGYRHPQEIKDQAAQKTGEVIDQAKEKTGQVVGQVQETAKSQISSQKDRAAEGLNSMAQALRQTGQQLRDQDNAPVAQFTEKAAEQVEKISSFLGERDVTDIVTEVERFARRQPALFLAGGLAVGLIGARFLRSSGQRAEQMQRPYSSTGTGSGAYYSGDGTVDTYYSGRAMGSSQRSYETQAIPTYSTDLEG